MTKKRKFKIKLICVLLLIICIFSVCVIAYYIYSNKEDPYAVYNVYREETKEYGELQHIEEHEEDQFYLSLYYPKLGIDNFDKTIEGYIDQIRTSTELQDNQIIYLDYDINIIYDHYISLIFHKTVYRADGVQVSETNTYYNYDKLKNVSITLHDVFRRDYMSKLRSEAKKIGLSEADIKEDNLKNFILTKDDVTILINQKEITLTYASNKEFIRLSDKNIPSLYQKETIIPQEQKVDPTKPMVAITFDDGPHPYNTKLIMDEFDKYNGKATFFMLGMNAVEYPDIVKEMYTRGFQLGNHSWDHSMRIAASDNLMTKDEVSEEIYKTQDVIFQAVGYDPSYFRPPYGAINDNIKAVSTLDFAMWDVDTEDWSNKDPNTITKIIETNIHDGAIILIHDIHDTSAQAVQKFLPILSKKGYQFVTIDTLMKYKKDLVTSDNRIIIAPNNK